MLVRHDAEFHVVITCGLALHTDPCSDEIIKAKYLDSHLAIFGSYMHGKVSGYDSGIRVKAKYTLVNPERDTLGDGKLCYCDDCVKEN